MSEKNVNYDISIHQYLINYARIAGVPALNQLQKCLTEAEATVIFQFSVILDSGIFE